jgi:DNA polymerase-3 subunit epsilon
LAPSGDEDDKSSKLSAGEMWRPSRRSTALPTRLTDEEAAAHQAFVEAMSDGALWKKT